MEQVLRRKGFRKKTSSWLSKSIFLMKQMCLHSWPRFFFICGGYFCSRGDSEHTKLSCSSLKEGSYPESCLFFGMKWKSFNAMAYKYFCLSVHRSVIENSKHFCLPAVGATEKKDPGGTLVWYKNAWAKNQKRFHSKPLSDHQILKLQKLGNYTTRYHANRPLWKENVCRLFKAGVLTLGLKDASRFSSHALHSLFFYKNCQ